MGLQWSLSHAFHKIMFSPFKPRSTCTCSMSVSRDLVRNSHIFWNTRSLFAHSVYKFYGFPVKNKACLLCRPLKVKAKSNDNFLSKSRRIFFVIFRAWRSGIWKLYFLLQKCRPFANPRCLSNNFTFGSRLMGEGSKTVHTFQEFNHNSQLIQLSPNFVCGQISRTY